MYESLLVLLFILLFIAIIFAIIFGYISLKYSITPFYEAPYSITESGAKISTGVSLIFVIVTFIALFYFMLSYTSIPIEEKVIGTVWYESPVYKND
jgi:hypothetical protein